MTNDFEADVIDAFPAIEDIESTGLRDKVIEAWCLGLDRGGWRDIEDIPYAWNIDEVSTAEHVRGVTAIARAMMVEQRRYHDAPVEEDVVIAASLLHDVGKCYEYIEYVPDELIDPDPTYASGTIPHSLSSYALAHEVGCPIEVQQAIPHVIGEIPTRSLEAELVKEANAASSNAITQATMGISLAEWIDQYSTATQ